MYVKAESFSNSTCLIGYNYPNAFHFLQAGFPNCQKSFKTIWKEKFVASNTFAIFTSLLQKLRKAQSFQSKRTFIFYNFFERFYLTSKYLQIMKYGPIFFTKTNFSSKPLPMACQQFIHIV